MLIDVLLIIVFFFFFSSRRRHTRLQGDWSSDVCSSDLMLFVDGRTASVPNAQFPIIETQITVNAAGPSRVPFTIYLPKLDTVNAVNLPIDGNGFTTAETKVTTPAIPGLEVTVPQGTRIIGPDGN